ncbi:MAG: NlpC/P60 family protein, partial [Spirochaetota bacterium]|nr:NlpC/P60 family protein [Spirochaetota bacterium]
MKRFALIIISATLFASCSLFQENHEKRPVTDLEASLALDLALTKINNPYIWGGNGPSEFDCSGLIIWSYQQALNQKDIFTIDGIIVDDITMNTMYNHNSYIIDFSETMPGDIIYITSDSNYITHGGLVVEVKENSVVFVNASSYYDKVILDEWGIDEIIREQWIED